MNDTSDHFPGLLAEVGEVHALVTANVSVMELAEYGIGCGNLAACDDIDWHNT